MHHKLRYTDEALVSAAKLSYQYIRYVVYVTISVDVYTLYLCTELVTLIHEMNVPLGE